MVTVMVDREITPVLIECFTQYPFVTVTGPRQAGKTTLCRAAFPNLRYVDLEDLNQREFARTDPVRFLSQLGTGAILDEVQRVPDLLSYLKVLADETRKNSLYVLTGSEQFGLSSAISQSLAGRTAMLRLFPFSILEARKAGMSEETDQLLYSGFYPRIYDQGIDPARALGDYLETYVERDVRRLGAIRNLEAFQRFLRLCAGRVGQLANLSALGADAGISHTTARNWMSILEASYIVFRLPPYFANIRKRLIKTPKLYFYDVGLASYLLGILNSDQIATHPLRGPLFENAAIAEAVKHYFNRGRRANLFFYRDMRGLECDLLYENGNGIGAMEIKSGATIASDWFKNLDQISKTLPRVRSKALVYGGADRQTRQRGQVVPLAGISAFLEDLDRGGIWGAA